MANCLRLVEIGRRGAGFYVRPTKLRIFRAESPGHLAAIISKRRKLSKFCFLRIYDMSVVHIRTTSILRAYVCPTDLMMCARGLPLLRNWNKDAPTRTPIFDQILISCVEQQARRQESNVRKYCGCAWTTSCGAKNANFCWIPTNSKGCSRRRCI